MVRSAMDVWSVKETFVDQFYTRYGAPVEGGPWISAGIGDYSLYAAHGNRSGVIYAYEPFIVLRVIKMQPGSERH